MSGLALIVFAAALNAADWNSEGRFRVLLEIVMKRGQGSSSPATVEVDFVELLSRQKASGTFDANTVEVVPIGFGDQRVPHRVETHYGIPKVTLHFVIPSEKCTNFAVYFDTLESKRGKPARYHGLVGDGDKFSEQFGRREIGASHFDSFADLDGDGDLDLFKGGVEPFVYCFENVGANRFVERGRLSSGGEVFKLPCSRSNRSWVTVAFHDIDGDGDQDFFPSFGDGPDSGRIVFYRTSREKQRLTFTRVGALETVSGVPLAGGPQAGGWFPSITFVKDFDQDGNGPDALVGSNHRCWLYRNAGALQFADPVALRADGSEIVLTNPRFDAADIDNDGDLDLFAGCQPGPNYWFKNIGTRTAPTFDKATPIAWDGKYLIGDAHSGVAVADLDRDGLLDVAAGASGSAPISIILSASATTVGFGKTRAVALLHASNVGVDHSPNSFSCAMRSGRTPYARWIGTTMADSICWPVIRMALCGFFTTRENAHFRSLRRVNGCERAGEY